VDVEQVVLGATVLLVCFLVLYPLLILAVSMFRVDIFGQPSRWTLENFAFLVTPPILSATVITLVISVGATLLAGAVGIALAWINARTNTPGASVLEPLNIVPFFLSPYVGAIAWTYLAAPRSGVLNNLLRQLGMGGDPLTPYTTWGMIWVLGLFYVPYMYLFVVAPLRRMDASLEEVARTAGCKLFDVVRRVTLPLVLPGILSGAIIVFVSAAGEFGVPLALGHPNGNETLTTQIFVLTEDLPAKYNRAAAAGAVFDGTVDCVYLDPTPPVCPPRLRDSDRQGHARSARGPRRLALACPGVQSGIRAGGRGATHRGIGACSALAQLDRHLQSRASHPRSLRIRICLAGFAHGHHQ
jgi:iron(III) transport system permease protein